MHQPGRDIFNKSFSIQQYNKFLQELNSLYNYDITFRVAESPVFVGKSFQDKLLEAKNDIIQFIVNKDFKQLSQSAIPVKLNVPNEDDHTKFLAIDFGVCEDEEGNITPQLIELQGFPSLFGYQYILSQAYENNFDIANNYSAYITDMNNDEYKALLKSAILGNQEPKHTILLEIEPEKQNTAIDFYATTALTGVDAVCISKVLVEGKHLYRIKNGEKIPIKRIYNRVIFDEFVQRTDLKCQFNLTQDVEVEWAGHPNWFFRISKYIMPMLKSAYVPSCTTLDLLTEIPKDLENYVLKPLFSFSGSGVKFNVTDNDILAVPDEEKSNYMLQKKVNYIPILQTADGSKVKVEIRLLLIWHNTEMPQLLLSLARLSRGEMIGVKYNKDKNWVGGSLCYFEK